MPETQSSQDQNPAKDKPQESLSSRLPPHLINGVSTEDLQALVSYVVQQTREQDAKAAAEAAAAKAEATPSTALTEVAKAEEPAADIKKYPPFARFLIKTLELPENKYIKPFAEFFEKKGVTLGMQTGVSLATTFVLQAIRPDQTHENVYAGFLAGVASRDLAEPVSKAFSLFGDYIIGKGVEAIKKHEDAKLVVAEKPEQEAIAAPTDKPFLVPPPAEAAPSNLIEMPAPAAAAKAAKPAAKLRA